VLSARRSLSLFLAGVVGLACWQVWLTWRLMEQDRNLELERSRERLEQTADLAIAELARSLGDFVSKTGNHHQRRDRKRLEERAVAETVAKTQFVRCPQMVIEAQIEVIVAVALRGEEAKSCPGTDRFGRGYSAAIPSPTLLRRFLGITFPGNGCCVNGSIA
jgi:hypothetical protein